MIRVWPIIAIFMLSGAAGLVYEIVWARQLVLVFGNTTQAISAILTGFFGGMAVGSAVGGRIGDRVRRPLRMYGLLELILVVVVLTTPVLFKLLHEVYRGAYNTLEATPRLLALLRFGLALAALGPATVLMGATLPALTRYLSRYPSELSASFGRLYAANTIGAVIGTIASGFVFIELVGLMETLLIGAVCSATAGLAALWLDRGRPPVSATVAATENINTHLAKALTPLRISLAVSLAFASGLTSLGYQVLWIRLLASGTGNSTYVFSTILAVFLVGLGSGAVVYASFRAQIRDVISLLAFGQIAVAVLVTLGMALVIGRHQTHFLYLSTDFGQLLRIFFRPVVLVVLPATFVMGLTFPATSSLVTNPTGRVATNAGLLLAFNTLGAIAGTLVVPFFIIPTVGSPAAVALMALVNIAVGMSLALLGLRGARSIRFVIPGAGLLAALLIILSIAKGKVFRDPNVATLRSLGGELYQSREDEIASVQAGALGGGKGLWVAGTCMTVLTVDAKLMPILPLILRPNSRAQLIIAFGMGTAYRTALKAGLRSDAVELVPSVPLMFSNFYPDANQVLSNPKGRVIIADGRNYVELTNRLYDIAIADPPPPIESSGVSVISCLEFYQATKARLIRGGVMMQFVSLNQTLDEFKAHLRTFRSVFANVIVAEGPVGYGLYMLGSDAPIAFDEPAIRTVLARPGVVDDLSSASDSPAHTMEQWVRLIPTFVRRSGDQVAGFAGSGPLITDDRPLSEYFLLRHTLGPSSPRLTPEALRAP